MKSGKKNKKNAPPKTTPKKPDKDDAFLNLMETIGVAPLQPKIKPDKTEAPTLGDNEPVDFDDSFNWPRDLSDLPTSKKFSGRKHTPRRTPPKKFKITRKFLPDDTLDLHGETKNDALDKVQSSIQTSERGNYQTLLIITGKGINSKEKGGVLGKAVWDWLRHYQVDHPIQFQWAPPFLGGKGAILVFF